MHNQIIPVSFHGDTLALVDHEGDPFVAMKPMTENMGLDWKGQYDKITEKFGSVMEIIPTTGGDGKQYEMICLPLRKLPAWLYSINPNKVKPELREKIVRYQDECDDVLWKYWTQGYVERAGANRPTVGQQIAAHGLLIRLPDKLEAERHPLKRQLLKEQINHACRILGITAPDLDAIGYAELQPPVPPLVDAFWEAVELIGLDKLNHSRAPDLVAINLMHFGQQADTAKVRIPPLQELRRVLRRSESPRFVVIKPVNSVLLSKAVRCWVFEADRQSPSEP